MKMGKYPRGRLGIRIYQSHRIIDFPPKDFLLLDPAGSFLGFSWMLRAEPHSLERGERRLVVRVSDHQTYRD